jgi:hypothetical protein
MFVVACTPEKRLETAVKSLNQECPMYLDDGLTITEIEYTGNYVIYYCEGDDMMYEFSQDLVTSALKDEMIGTLRLQALTNSDAEEFMQTLRDAKVGIIYHYFTSSSSMDVVIEYTEL